jgi:hypothetical protein
LGWWEMFSGNADHCPRTLSGERGRRTYGWMLFSQVRQEASEQGSRSRVATSFDFLIQLCSIATALLPPLEQVGFVGIKPTPSRGGPTAFGKGLGPDELTDGFASHAEASGNFTQTHALLVQYSDSFISARAVGTAHLRGRLDSWRGGQTP